MKKYGFPKQNRLISKNDFALVFLEKNIINDTFLRCYYKKNPYNYTRMGIVIGRKFGKAHTRNRFKRLVRESFRLYPDNTFGMDIVILPNLRNKSVEYDAICESMSRLLVRSYKKLGYTNPC